MNLQYFACSSCKECTEAGYRWGWTHLVDSGIVQPNQEIDQNRVHEASSFWSPPPGDAVLADELNRAKRFLQRHAGHSIFYGDMELLEGPEERSFLDWIYEAEEGDALHATPRYFKERMNMCWWSEVEEFVSGAEVAPWWWDYPEYRSMVRKHFEELLSPGR